MHQELCGCLVQAIMHVRSNFVNFEPKTDQPSNQKRWTILQMDNLLMFSGARWSGFFFLQVLFNFWEIVTCPVPGAYERREGASNCRTLFVPSSVESRALNLAENAPYKVSSMFAPTLLRSQQVAIITAGRLAVVTSKLINTSNL